jgi:hypothetical protein
MPDSSTIKTTTELPAASLPRPYGDPWDLENYRSFVPVESQIIFTQVKGPYTLLDRKLWPVLLHHAWNCDDSLEKEWAIPISRIHNLFKNYKGNTNSSWIRESINRLAGTQMVFGESTAEKSALDFSVFISSAKIEKDHETGLFTLYYTIPKPLRVLLKDPICYGRLRTQLLLSLSSKYAISLYEVLTTVINRRYPVLKLSIQELREILKVPDKKLKRWVHLRQRALDPALEELNAKSHISGFKIEIEVEQGSRNKVTGVILKTEKTQEMLLEDQIAQGQDLFPELQEELAYLQNPDQMFLAFADTEDSLAEIQLMAPDADLDALLKEWYEWARTKADFPPQNPRRAFIGFCKKKFEREQAEAVGKSQDLG